MNVYHAVHPAQAKNFDTQQLREHFLIEDCYRPDEVCLNYTLYDRMIVGGAMPVNNLVELPNYPILKSSYFLERREMGVLNVGEVGTIEVDGSTYELDYMDLIYLPKGAEGICFASKIAATPAKFYILSCPAHTSHSITTQKFADLKPMELGASQTANERKIYKYIHLEGIKSCQLVMGLTILSPGSIWNTMPAHTHDRRMEAYHYFNLPDDQRIFHLMGEPQEIRPLICKNASIVLSPPWSIHSGAGTTSYSFIWGMAGENLNYADMDLVPISQLR